MSTVTTSPTHLHRQKKGNTSRRSHAHHQMRKSAAVKRWSKHVNDTSDAMDVRRDLFKSGSADDIAASLKSSSEHSRRRKASPFQSAMSMLNFYINRGGRNLGKERKRTLEQAKKQLRKAFGRAP